MYLSSIELEVSSSAAQGNNQCSGNSLSCFLLQAELFCFSVDLTNLAIAIKSQNSAAAAWMIVIKIYKISFHSVVNSLVER